MACQGLVARPKKWRRGLTRADRGARKAPDLVQRDFGAAAPDEKWCGDLTEIPTGEGPLRLAANEDLFSRRLLGFAVGPFADAELARASLLMAVARRGGTVRGVTAVLALLVIAYFVADWFLRQPGDTRAQPEPVRREASAEATGDPTD
ncbi:MAG: hypothetical protein IH850_10730 [Acidobacteria bacterium]|nr:hypothetical protein [Acidobacteriota bacterium]